ncbi:hypothetical protein JVT61DRAFT_1231 [Boletus reticuloceps]|uniref:Homeobox domain-containing protein n=1 Tax=Boletus reticuloceps TaxID=495285 RepID=A0A8I2YQI3_9AGAM|nr:hypothetical protein JVT61DRAFT_1231 [Boletus reticuloceps]
MSRKKAILSNETVISATIPPNSTNNGERRPRRPARERLQSTVLEELWSIWQTDPRVPSLKSRRSWAISRNASPRLVDNWFLRRRTCAKKAGQPISAASYNLPLDPPIAPKREQSTTPLELEAAPDLPSDDTLKLLPTPCLKTWSRYQKEHKLLHTRRAFGNLLLTTTIPSRSRGLMQLSSHSSLTFFGISSADLYAAKDRCDENVSFENPSFLICNQGQGKQSKLYVYTLFNAVWRRGALDDKALSNSDDSRGNPFVLPRLDFLPDTHSELSAIPFLFRTPRTVLPNNAVSHPSVHDWAIVEDELGRLVNDGKLDFSFLDVPHLTSMELFDSP